MRNKASLVLGYTVADFLTWVNLGGGALEGRGLVELFDRFRVPDPV